VSPRAIQQEIRRDAPVLDDRTEVRPAVEAVLGSGLPALPVTRDGRYAGIFGEREFIGALFPGYLKTLGYVGFVGHSIEEALEKRRECAMEAVRDHMNTEHVDVPSDVSDVQIAETFLSHRVLVVPVTDEGRVVGVVTRSDFFGVLASRFLAGAE
jgi:CBS domain-containing protein